MKHVINSKYLSTLIFILSIVVVVKLIWMAVSLSFLPKSGIEYQKSTKAKKLYYRVRLTNASKAIAPVISKKPPKSNQVSSMRGYELLGLYYSSDKLVVTVEKGRKTTVLSKGEKVDGFKLISGGADFAVFKKNGEEFKLTLKSSKIKTHKPNKVSSTRQTPKTQPKQESKIVDDGDVKRIPKTLLTSYTKDIDKIWKDIGLAQYKKGSQPYGFKVNYVKKGSDMEKLGLKKGDILTAVNAETLNLSTAMSFFRDINNLDNLTLTVERNGQSKDLEYEIQ
ncbi:MAG TPA: PDZ domain-containing protein [Campylobacterales bacterium]|nr:PDZ domain-containing protein [Campylobacterales bacterium]HHS92603.1 PDZ domain-containing protein [Campylobacterales bacterium]